MKNCRQHALEAPTMAFVRSLVISSAFLSSFTTGWIVPIRRVSVVKPFLTMSSDASKHSKTLRVLGVCGGIGSGKSHACKLLVENSDQVVAHLEADSMAHAVYTPGNPALTEIAQEFGSQILQEDGNVNRKELGAIVFSDPAKMAKLEQIVWPYVKQEIQKRIQELQQEHECGVVVLEAAVLLDAGWDDIFDAIWVVTTPPTVALERLVANRNFTKEEAQKRIDAQEPRRGIGNLDEEVEKGVVTRVIENEGTEERLQEALLQALSDPTAWKEPEPL